MCGWMRRLWLRISRSTYFDTCPAPVPPISQRLLARRTAAPARRPRPARTARDPPPRTSWLRSMNLMATCSPVVKSTACCTKPKVPLSRSRICRRARAPQQGALCVSALAPRATTGRRRAAAAAGTAAHASEQEPAVVFLYVPHTETDGIHSRQATASCRPNPAPSGTWGALAVGSTPGCYSLSTRKCLGSEWAGHRPLHEQRSESPTPLQPPRAACGASCASRDERQSLLNLLSRRSALPGCA